MSFPCKLKSCHHHSCHHYELWDETCMHHSCQLLPTEIIPHFKTFLLNKRGGTKSYVREMANIILASHT